MLPFALATADASDRPDEGDRPPPEPLPERRTDSVIPPPDAADLPPHRAYRATPRSEPAPPEPPPKRSRVQRLVLAALLIAAAGLIGYMLSRPSDAPETPGMLTRSVEAAGTLRLVLSTDLPAEARQFARDEFGWRVGVPSFEPVTLRGVAIARTAPAVEVPVFLYTDGDGRDVAVFAYSYALLDQVPDWLALARTDYDALATGTPVLRRTDGTDVLLWRDRDDIYVAVTDLPPSALRDGLSMER